MLVLCRFFLFHLSFSSLFKARDLFPPPFFHFPVSQNTKNSPFLTSAVAFLDARISLVRTFGKADQCSPFLGILRSSAIIQAPDGYYTKECYSNPFSHKKYANKYCAFPKLQVQREELVDYGTVIKIATHIFPTLNNKEAPKIQHTSLRIIFLVQNSISQI